MPAKHSKFAELQDASSRGDTQQVLQLLDEGTDLNADFGAPRGWSPLMHAAHYGHLETVKLLVERGARLDALEIDRWGTALDLAIAAGHEKIVRYLKSKRAPLGAKIPNKYRNGKLGGWIEDKVT